MHGDIIHNADDEYIVHILFIDRALSIIIASFRVYEISGAAIFSLAVSQSQFLLNPDLGLHCDFTVS